MPRRKSSKNSPFQPALPFAGSGRKRRPGAGRPQGSGRAPGHVSRPKVTRHQPLHITLRIREGLPSLRKKEVFRCLRLAVSKARARGLSIAEFSILSNHVHLIVEVTDNRALAKAFQALTLSFARRFNTLMNRTGAVFAERYHLHVLKTPSEVKHALAYVLLNESKHLSKKFPSPQIIRLDPFSTAWKFNRWRTLGARPSLESTNWPEDWVESWFSSVLSPPRSWLLAKGWTQAQGRAA